MDQYFEEKNTHVIKKVDMSEAADADGDAPGVFRLGVNAEEKEAYDIVDLRPLLQGVKNADIPTAGE